MNGSAVSHRRDIGAILKSDDDGKFLGHQNPEHQLPEENSMLLTDLSASPLDKDRRAAAQLLVHLLQFQSVETQIGKSGGETAANFCADFIEKFAERLKGMSKP